MTSPAATDYAAVAREIPNKGDESRFPNFHLGRFELVSAHRLAPRLRKPGCSSV
jgi:hypothetical protein